MVVLLAWVNRNNINRVAAGAPAPDFVAYTMDGEAVTLADYQDKVVLLNIWATWCPPCREEMPSMQRLYEAMEDEDNFEILAVSVDVNPGERDEFGRLSGEIDVFADSLGLTFPVLWDQELKIPDPRPLLRTRSVSPRQSRGLHPVLRSCSHRVAS